MLLNNHTHFSLKYGLASPEELLETLSAGGHEAFAITDINNTSACMEVLRMAPEYDMRAAIGIDFRNGAQQLFVGIAMNMQGFHELNTFLSYHLHNKLPFEKQAPTFDHVQVIYPLHAYPEQLCSYEFVGVPPNALNRLPFMKGLPHRERMVAFPTCTFRCKRDYNAHRLLRAIAKNCLLSQLPPAECAGPEQCFLTREALLSTYAQHPYLIQNAQQLLNDCQLNFSFKKNRNRSTWTGNATTDRELLHQLAREGLSYRYGKVVPAIVKQRLEKELNTIDQLGFSAYFLINWDMVQYAKRKGYYHVGRGSGANSLVAYLIGITDVDPVELDLYFERFINPYRSKPPDFDIDFSWTDRDDVTRYLFQTHGYERTALVGTYITFKHRSMFRELGKVFGLPDAEIKRLQSDPGPNTLDQYGKLVLRYTDHIAGLPSSLSVHACGILISDAPIHAYTGTFMPPKGYATTQFDMQVAEDVGLHKFDVLSQRGLGKIKDTIALVEENRGEVIDIHDVAWFKQDPRIKQMLKVGDTIGCFYVESPAMRSLLTKLEADDYLRLVAASSIIRPGVAKSGMMREYILRYRDPARREKARDALPALYEILKETYGVMVYQEDVIRVAHFFAGLTLAEADVLRRGMSWRFKQRNEFNTVKEKFFANCAAKQYDATMVHEVWMQIESFANFAFAKGHSASYAVESYQALFLKAHYPIEYMVANLNNGGGFYRAELYLHEARLHGAEVQAPCINQSNALNSVQGKTIYLGFCMVNGLEQEVLVKLLSARKQEGHFFSLRDVVDRVLVPLEQLCILIRANAFRFTGKDKKELLWDAHLLLGKQKRATPEVNLFRVEPKAYQLPQLWYHELEQAYDEMELLGFPLCDPFTLLTNELPSKLVVADLHERLGQTVQLVGYIIHRKTTRTHNRTPMSFGTLLDLDGQWLDTVQFPQIDAKYQFRGPGCYLITGKVAKEFGFLTVETIRLERLDNKNMDAANTRLRSTETYYRKPLRRL